MSGDATGELLRVERGYGLYRLDHSRASGAALLSQLRVEVEGAKSTTTHSPVLHLMPMPAPTEAIQPMSSGPHGVMRLADDVMLQQDTEAQDLKICGPMLKYVVSIICMRTYKRQ